MLPEWGCGPSRPGYLSTAPNASLCAVRAPPHTPLRRPSQSVFTEGPSHRGASLDSSPHSSRSKSTPTLAVGPTLSGTSSLSCRPRDCGREESWKSIATLTACAGGGLRGRGLAGVTQEYRLSRDVPCVFAVRDVRQCQPPWTRQDVGATHDPVEFPSPRPNHMMTC
jgi:hypothetical protein